MISVIVPVYNGATDGGAILRDCLDSILSQKGVTFELIVVNDGSTDDTGKILAEYSLHFPAIRVMDKSNGGVSAARNYGVRYAYGEYVCFVDADDRLLPGALRTLLSAAEDAPVTIGGLLRARRNIPDISEPVFRHYTGFEFAERTLYQRGGHNSPWAMLIRRSLLIEEPFDETMRYEDLELSCRLYLRAGKIAVTDMPVYFYRDNPDSFLNRWTPERTDALRATESIEGFVAQHERRLLAAARDRRLSANFNIFILASLNEADDTLTRNCWRIIKKYRRASLFNPRVRLKNKIGIIISYLGRYPLQLAAKLLQT